MAKSRLVVGIADHCGWAVFVCVRAQDGHPEIVDRRRVDLIEPGMPKQPYEHDTAGLGVAEADRLVLQVRESALLCAERALSRLRSSMEAQGEIVAIALREPPLAQLPKTIAEVRASYSLMTHADGTLFHDALCKAATSLGLHVAMLKRGTERSRAAEASATTAEHLDQFLNGLRTSLGPPWQQDHKTATAYAIAALGKHGQLRLKDQ